ncbi:eukaryotic translation initiation factor 4 gamma [Plasmodium gonderi]|uniref:Eukaryotic translation initiation factor 4 gamma n=1 Tax=Plasmodium gonderi TaxID=77519 RepID=A0A1Y1JLC0_PLAGO|nr:eukaryotic translation initiation factor 4 gamma [Plasmodium gonderi]GAW83336.1 eukaryotic translation initiation factor 4 gamma [Plasmodium gonderi]
MSCMDMKQENVQNNEKNMNEAQINTTTDGNKKKGDDENMNRFNKNSRKNNASGSYNQQGSINHSSNNNPEDMDNEWNNLRSGSSHTFRNANKSMENNSFSSMNKKNHVMDQGNWRSKKEVNGANYRNNNFNKNEMNSNMNSSDNLKFEFVRNFKNSNNRNVSTNNSVMKNINAGTSAKGVNKLFNNNNSNTNNNMVSGAIPANGMNNENSDNYTNRESVSSNQNKTINSNQDNFTNLGGNFNNNFSSMNNKDFYKNTNKNNKFNKSNIQNNDSTNNFNNSLDGKKNMNYKNQYSSNFKNDGNVNNLPYRNINMDEGNKNYPNDFNQNMNNNYTQTKFTTLIENDAEGKNINISSGYNNASSNLNNSSFYKQKYDNNGTMNSLDQGKNEFLPFGIKGTNSKYYGTLDSGKNIHCDDSSMDGFYNQNTNLTNYSNQNKKGNMYSNENVSRSNVDFSYNSNVGNIGHMEGGYPEGNNPSIVNQGNRDVTQNFYINSSRNDNSNNMGIGSVGYMNNMTSNDNANFTKRECVNVDNHFALRMQNQANCNFENSGNGNTNGNFNAQPIFMNKPITNTFNSANNMKSDINSNTNFIDNNSNSTNFIPGAGSSTNNVNMNNVDNRNNNDEEEDNDDWGELGEDKYIDINSIIKKKNVILNQLADLNESSKKGNDNKNKKKAKSKKEEDKLFLIGADGTSTSMGDKKKNKKNKNKNSKSNNNKENEKSDKTIGTKSLNSEISPKEANSSNNNASNKKKGKNKKGNIGSETEIKMNEGSITYEGTNEKDNNTISKKEERNEHEESYAQNELNHENCEKKEVTEKPAKALYVFKRKENMSPHEYMERQIKSLLNKLTVENFPIITEKMCQIMDSRTSIDEIQTVVNEVINKAVLEHDWSEMYADVCQALKWRSPNFEMKKKSSFEIALLKKIQEEYENLPSTFESTMKEKLKNDENEEELSFVEQKQKKRLFGIVKLIGELFQRQIVSISIVISIAHDLLIAYDEPKEYCIEAFLQLIYSTGFFIDKMEKYKNILDTWFGRLKELQRKKMYSKRIKFVIQDVFDLRLSEWRKKTHKDTAKGLNELRSQLETEEMMGGSIHLAQLGNIVIVGERHNIRNNESYSKYMQEQERLSKANQKK